jgi:hypothetical protein
MTKIIYFLNYKSPKIIAPFPPQITESNWYKNLNFATTTSPVFQAIWAEGNSEIEIDNDNKQFSLLELSFNSVSEASAWFSANRLSDPALISVFNEWKTAYNITYIECCLTEIFSDTPGLFNKPMNKDIWSFEPFLPYCTN